MDLSLQEYILRFAGMSQKNSFLSFLKLAFKLMILKQEQENWDLGNTDIANNQQLLSSDDLNNF